MAPQVVKLDLGVIPSPAGPGELLLADEWSCRLVFVPSAQHTHGLPGQRLMCVHFPWNLMR